MLYTFGEWNGADSPADTCIIGSGPAGLTLAARLARTGRRIILLEAGDNQETDSKKEIYKGEVADPLVHWPLDTYRVRALGGTSSIWGGRCIPYDPIDFEERSWVPHSGWPIGYHEVARHYPEALAAAEAGQFAFEPSGPIVPGLISEWLETTTERFSRPTNFWARYGEELTRARNTEVVTDAAVTGIRLTQDGGRVDHLEVTGPGGARRMVRARDYVIAAGGLETTRLLLASNDVMPEGIGNGGGWLGRGYMCHLAATFGEIAFSGDARSIGFDYERDAEGIYIRRRLALTEAAQQKLRAMNFTARLHIADANDPAHGDPVLSLIFLAAFAVKYEYSRGAREADRSLPVMVRHLANIARHPVRLAHFIATWGSRRYLSDRRIPSIALSSARNIYPIEFHSEQAPNPDSRVMLGEDCDALGMRRLRVDWRTTPLDFHTIRESYRLMQRELERTGTGRLTFDDENLEAQVLKAGAYGGHHSGTTRMAASERHGVVDGDCRVHGVDNLFVASSAVLPTSSQANPTLTILALALRLGDHLEKRGNKAAMPISVGPGSEVVVTGAAGFVGRAVARKLVEQGLRVRAGTRASRWTGTEQGISVMRCDVMASQELDAAFAGASAVVHCAVGGARDTRVIVEGTRNVAEAALRAGVRHLVHISSVAVYGFAKGVIDEAFPTDRPHGAYGQAKCEAEAIVREAAARGLVITILRPSLVYGPGSHAWVELFVERMASGRWHALGAAGEGDANLVHVDDLAAFVARCLKAGQAEGSVSVFNVNGADIPTWNDYLTRLNVKLGLPPMPPPESPPGRMKLLMRKGARLAAHIARKLGSEGVARKFELQVLVIPSFDESERFAGKRRYAIDAMREAGFEPEIDIEGGLATLGTGTRPGGSAAA